MSSWNNVDFSNGQGLGTALYSTGNLIAQNYDTINDATNGALTDTVQDAAVSFAAAAGAPAALTVAAGIAVYNVYENEVDITNQVKKILLKDLKMEIGDRSDWQLDLLFMMYGLHLNEIKIGALILCV